jgi:hypothetical protein
LTFGREKISLVVMAGAWAYYIRSNDVDALRSFVPRYARLDWEQGADHVQVQRDVVDDARLRALSEQLSTDVILLAFDADRGAFDYGHWRSGQLVRRLAYNCADANNIWEKVQGQEEPWECWQRSPRLGDEVSTLTNSLVDPWWSVGGHFKLSGWDYNVDSEADMGWLTATRKT